MRPLLAIKNQKIQLIVEIALIALLFFSVRTLFGSIKYSSQIAELISLAAITYLLKRRNTTWKDLGFTKPKSWLLALVYFVLCVICIGVTFNFIIQPLFPHGANEINGGAAITFNEMLFQLVVIGIGMAAIGEEMLFRGFLLNNLDKIFGERIIGAILAVLIQAFIFAILHRGIQGMVSAGVIGLLLGIFYIVSGRNLFVVMAAHAVPDVLSIISSYQSL